MQIPEISLHLDMLCYILVDGKKLTMGDNTKFPLYFKTPDKAEKYARVLHLKNDHYEIVKEFYITPEVEFVETNETNNQELPDN